MKHPEIRARLLKIIATESDDTAWTLSNKHLMSLIKLYVEEEREACAKLCIDEVWASTVSGTPVEAFNYASRECANRIRARGEA